MAPHYWLLVYMCKNLVFARTGFEPVTSTYGNDLVACGLPIAYTVVLVNITNENIFELEHGLVGGEKSRGLAPALGYTIGICDHMRVYKTYAQL
jgi:hypothetical protein